MEVELVMKLKENSKHEIDFIERVLYTAVMLNEDSQCVINPPKRSNNKN